MLSILFSTLLINTAYNISDACTKALAKNKISLFEAALHGHEVINVDLIA